MVSLQRLVDGLISLFHLSFPLAAPFGPGADSQWECLFQALTESTLGSRVPQES